MISEYGSDVSAIGGYRTRAHAGIDFGASPGVYAVAAGPGRVLDQYKSPASGYVVTLYHPAMKLYTMYAHLERINVRDGDLVSRGQKIGSVGLFPNSGGVAHLHWEVCERPCTGELENSIDPTKFDQCFDPEHPFSSSPFLSLPVRCDRLMARRICDPSPGRSL